MQAAAQRAAAKAPVPEQAAGGCHRPAGQWSRLAAHRALTSHRPPSSATRRSLRARERRLAALEHADVATLADLSFELLPEIGLRPELAVLASAAFATLSLVTNFWGGVVQENKRAELQLEFERDKLHLQQLAEVRSVIARYRGPLLESAIDLEQRLWHLAADGGCQYGSAREGEEDIRYLLFTMAQFLGFVEVVRREGPRERHFLQACNPQGSDTLSALVEGVRFVLCASPSQMESWYLEGRERPHPGWRTRPSRRELLARRASAAGAAGSSDGSSNGSSSGSDGPPSYEDRLRLPRGAQRAIGSYMITTPMGAERHYTHSYAEFHTMLGGDAFSHWLLQMEADMLDLATGPAWQGEGPFPFGRWTRVLLLQQLLVEVTDVLDPDCVRLPLSRRTRLHGIRWGPLPSVEQYQKQLQALSRVSDYGGRPGATLEGIRDLLSTRSMDDGGGNGNGSSNSGGGGNGGGGAAGALGRAAAAASSAGLPRLSTLRVQGSGGSSGEVAAAATAAAGAAAEAEGVRKRAAFKGVYSKAGGCLSTVLAP